MPVTITSKLRSPYTVPHSKGEITLASQTTTELPDDIADEVLNHPSVAALIDEGKFKVSKPAAKTTAENKTKKDAEVKPPTDKTP